MTRRKDVLAERDPEDNPIKIREAHISQHSFSSSETCKRAFETIWKWMFQRITALKATIAVVGLAKHAVVSQIAVKKIQLLAPFVGLQDRVSFGVILYINWL